MWSFDPVDATKWFVFILATMLFVLYLRADRARAALTVLALTYVSLGFSLLHAYVYPRPLPLVALVLRVGDPVSGGYITRNGNTWYVHPDDTREIVAVESGTVAKATMRGRKQSEPRTVREIVVSWWNDIRG
jgi:hypothetical protein